MEYRKPDAEPVSKEDDSGDHGLEMAAEDLCRAVSSGDHKGAARALRAAFEILDAMPHIEGESLNEDSE